MITLKPKKIHIIAMLIAVCSLVFFSLAAFLDAHRQLLKYIFYLFFGYIVVSFVIVNNFLKLKISERSVVQNQLINKVEILMSENVSCYNLILFYVVRPKCSHEFIVVPKKFLIHNQEIVKNIFLNKKNDGDLFLFLKIYGDILVVACCRPRYDPTRFPN